MSAVARALTFSPELNVSSLKKKSSLCLIQLAVVKNLPLNLASFGVKEEENSILQYHQH